MGSLNLLTTTAPLGDANEVHKTNKIDKMVKHATFTFISMLSIQYDEFAEKLR